MGLLLCPRQEPSHNVNHLQPVPMTPSALDPASSQNTSQTFAAKLSWVLVPIKDALVLHVPVSLGPLVRQPCSNFLVMIRNKTR